jgi:hypothetical protein
MKEGKPLFDLTLQAGLINYTETKAIVGFSLQLLPILFDVKYISDSLHFCLSAPI